MSNQLDDNIAHSWSLHKKQQVTAAAKNSITITNDTRPGPAAFKGIDAD